MTNFFRKIHIALTLSLITSIGYTHGEQRNALLCNQNENCYSCEPTCCEPTCGTGFISAGLLYWSASQGGLDYCYPVENNDYLCSYDEIVSKFKGKSEDPHFKWDAGFRLGTGYEFASGWDVGVFWTHFHTHTTKNNGRHLQVGWKLEFDVVDVLVGNSFNAGSCFTVRPFGGLRGAKIKEHVHKNLKCFDESCSNSYSIDGYSFSGNSNNGSTIGSAHGKNKLLGLGPLLGVEADWNLGCGFSLYANTSFAILYGNFHVSFDETEDFLDARNVRSTKSRLHACQAVFDIGCGIRWQTRCFCNNLAWIQLGLEHHRYFNQNRLGNYGDLCLDGLNLSAGIAF